MRPSRSQDWPARPAARPTALLVGFVLLTGLLGSAPAMAQPTGPCCEAPGSTCVFFDPAQAPLARYVPPQSPVPFSGKDFAIIREAGTYHLFYIKHNRNLPAGVVNCGGNCGDPNNEIVFGHATSSDLESWSDLGDVVPRRGPGSGFFDADHVWAPSVVKGTDGTFYMFYTGVRQNQQSIGVATTSDLFSTTWTRYDDPVHSCLQIPSAQRWMVCPTDPAQVTDFRDPNVVDNGDGTWSMLYVARLDSTHMRVGHAQNTAMSTGPWTDLGPLAEPSSAAVESPHAMLHSFYRPGSVEPDIYSFLFFTKDLAKVYVTRRNLTEPHLDPQTMSLTQFLNGAVEGTDLWFATEQLRDATGEYLAVVRAHDGSETYPPFVGYCRDLNIMEFHQIVWGNPGAFTLHRPNPVRNLTASGSSACTGTTVTLTFDALLDAGETRTASLEVIRDPGGANQSIPPSQVNLPASVSLTGAQTTLNWTVGTANPGTVTTYAIRVSSQPRLAQVNVTVNDLCDVTPPATTNDVAIMAYTTVPRTVTLRWTAPGDDGTTGTAAQYSIRKRSGSEITDANWATSTEVSGAPAPAPAGTTQTVVVNGLTSGVFWYFALKARDEANNWSGVSNNDCIKFGSPMMLCEGGGGGEAAPASPVVVPRELAINGVHPNPTDLGAAGVTFTLAGALPAKLEVLDVSGRRIESHDISRLGAGEHEFRIGGHARLRPGHYWVRIREGDRSATRAVIVIH